MGRCQALVKQPFLVFYFLPLLEYGPVTLYIMPEDGEDAWSVGIRPVELIQPCYIYILHLMY